MEEGLRCLSQGPQQRRCSEPREPHSRHPAAHTMPKQRPGLAERRRVTRLSRLDKLTGDMLLSLNHSCKPRGPSPHGPGSLSHPRGRHSEWEVSSPHPGAGYLRAPPVRLAVLA